MSKRVLTLVIVLVVLAGLIGTYVIVTRPRPAAAAKSQLVEISKGDKDKLVKIVLSGRPEGALTLVKNGKDWSVQGAAALALDQSTIDDLVLTFTSLEAEQVIDEKPTDLAQFGLKPPRAVGEATFSDGTVKRLFLGDKSPTGNTYYLQAEGDPRVFTVWTINGEHLHWTVSDLRDKKITPVINYDEVTYFKLSKSDGTVIELARKTEEQSRGYELGFGSFVMTRPYSYPRGVDADKQDQLVKGPQQVQISSFVEDNPKDLSRYGLARPAAEAIVRDKTASIDFLFGAATGGTGGTGGKTYFMIRGRPNVYTTDTSNLAFLKNTPWDLVDKFVFIPSIDDVDRLDITSGGATHSLVMTRVVTKKAEKKEDKDTVETTYTADGKKVEESSFKAFYQQVIGTRAEGEIQKRVPPTPDLTVKFSMNKGPEKVVTVVYAPYDIDFDAVFLNGRTGFAVGKEQIAKIRTKLDELLKGEKVVY